MLFCSYAFARFFAVVFAVYWLPWKRVRFSLPLPGRLSGPGRTFTVTGDEIRIWWLVGASFYFYASWNKMLALLILATTLMDFCIGLAMDGSRSERLRRFLLLFSLTANLGLLVYFKYANFFLESLQESLRAAGVPASVPLLKVILPVGISFYTF